MNRWLAAGCVAASLVLISPAAANAATASGATALAGPAVSGGHVDVDVSVLSAAPVVAYDYSLVNECWFGKKTTGPADSVQRDDIVDWVFSSPPTHGDVPHATMSLDLTSVPAASHCRVSIVHANTLVKGSVTGYVVG